MRGMLTQPYNAPHFCFEVMEADRRKKNPESLLFVQSDWEYAGLACAFGWVPCECGFTDGTVNCKHKTVSEMLADAYDFLMQHVGDKIPWEEH